MGVYTLCYQYNNPKNVFLDSIQSLEKPGGRPICLDYL
jgi:hypothetical protein